MLQSVTKFFAKFLACAALVAAPTLCLADDTKAGGGSNELRELSYSGLNVSRTDIGFDNVDSLVNLGFLGGIRIPTIDWISAELAGSVTVIPGKVKEAQAGTPGSPTGCGPLGLSPCPGGNASTSEGDATTFDIGVYAVVRSPGRFYATGRLGWRYFGSSVDSSDDKLYDQRTGAAFGVGAGWRWGESLSGVEFMYNHLSSDVNQLSLGIVYGFGGR